MYQFKQSYTPRNDNVPGYIYLIEAIGYHGLLPGFYLRRCKIGLSKNPQARLQNFIDNQPPCDVQILRTIYVKDMAGVENELHKQFKYCNVRLTKSKEWFDLNPIDFLRVNGAFNRHLKEEKTTIQPINIIFSLLGISMVLMALMSTQTTPNKPQIKPINTIEGVKSL